MTEQTQGADAAAATISWAGAEHPVSSIPAHNAAVLIQRALNHIQSNELASYLKGRKDKAEKDATEQGGVFDEASWETANEDALSDAWLAEKTKVIFEGVIGVRAAGVAKQSRLDRTISAMVRTAIENSEGVRSGKVKLPKKNEKGSGDWWSAMVQKVLSDDGNKTRFTDLAVAELKRQDEQAQALGGIGI